jgi:hypothetical protein
MPQLKKAGDRGINTGRMTTGNLYLLIKVTMYLNFFNFHRYMC